MKNIFFGGKEAWRRKRRKISRRRKIVADRAGPTDIEGSITIRGPRGPKDGEKDFP